MKLPFLSVNCSSRPPSRGKHTDPASSLFLCFQDYSIRLLWEVSSEDLYKLSRQANFLESECISLAYKLYLSMGFTNSLELLQNKYGEVSFATLYFLIYPIDVRAIDMLNEKLMAFLFNGTKDNSVMASILSGKSKELFLNLYQEQQPQIQQY